jgi:hypothetical protein
MCTVYNMIAQGAHNLSIMVMRLRAAMHDTCTGTCNRRLREVNTISVYAVAAKQSDQVEVVLHLEHVMVLLPEDGASVVEMQMLDLPLVGNMQATAGDVTVVPYVGEVKMAGESDVSNVQLMPWRGTGGNKGFIARGAVSERQ